MNIRDANIELAKRQRWEHHRDVHTVFSHWHRGDETCSKPPNYYEPHNLYMSELMSKYKIVPIPFRKGYFAIQMGGEGYCPEADTPEMAVFRCACACEGIEVDDA